MKTFIILALVCRFFCAVALPRVYERVVFSGNITATDRTQACCKTTWASQIVANTDPAKFIALHIKEYYFRYWSGPKQEQLFRFPFSTLFCPAMARMTNIRKVKFDMSFVKKEHWEAMAALKQLDCLHFSDCSFTENPPDQELSVRAVTLVRSHTPFTLWPIATSTLRTLETDDLEAVLKLVTARQLAIKNFVLDTHYTDFKVNMLLQVFEQLRDLESVTIRFRVTLAASPLISGLSLKKLFPRLCSFTVKAVYSETVPQHVTVKVCFMSSILPSQLIVTVFIRYM